MGICAQHKLRSGLHWRLSTQVRLRRLDNRVPMVDEQAIRMDPKAIPLMYFAKQFQKIPILTPTIEDRPPLDSAMHDMIPSIRNIDSKGSGHPSSQHSTTPRASYMLIV